MIGVQRGFVNESSFVINTLRRITSTTEQTSFSNTYLEGTCPNLRVKANSDWHAQSSTRSTTVSRGSCTYSPTCPCTCLRHSAQDLQLGTRAVSTLCLGNALQGSERLAELTLLGASWSCKADL